MKPVLGSAVSSAFALILLALSAAPQAGTTYYRWLDERGQPVHSDRPPPKGIDYEVISTGGRFKREVAAETGAVPRDLQSSTSNSFDRKPVDSDTQIQKNPETCERARKNLTTLETWDQVHVRDENGEVRELTKEEKEQRKAEARRQISLHCAQTATNR
ncbi:MAG: DUF4124 domain-containing protein [Parahaliea sp.]